MYTNGIELKPNGSTAMYRVTQAKGNQDGNSLANKFVPSPLAYIAKPKIARDNDMAVDETQRRNFLVQYCKKEILT